MPRLRPRATAAEPPVLWTRPCNGVFPCRAGVLNPNHACEPPGELERSRSEAGAPLRPAGLRLGRGGPEDHWVDSEPSAGPGEAARLGETPPLLCCLIHVQVPGTLAQAPRLRASLTPQRPWASL